MKRSLAFRHLLVYLVAAGVLLFAAHIDAQQAPEFPPISGVERAGAIDSFSAAIQRFYVFPELATELAALLEERLKSGAYDGLDRVDDFARAVEEDLQEASPDAHLRVRPLSVAYIERARNPPPPELDAATSPRERLARTNFGVPKVEVLEGNVGYIRLDAFHDASYSGPTIDAAMAFLTNVDALIFDIRENGGGSPTLAQAIGGYLFEEPEELSEIYNRMSDRRYEYWTLPTVAGTRRPDVPVFILTSERTFSAAEAFAYDLQQLERATVVGEVTAGGANPARFVRFLDLKVGIQVPFGQAINPLSGKNWEGTGVIPDISVPAEEAFETARQLAVEAVRAGG